MSTVSIAKCLNIKSEITHRWTGSISRAGLADLLGIPQGASIYIKVPDNCRGGNLDIQEAPIFVEWVTSGHKS